MISLDRYQVVYCFRIMFFFLQRLYIEFLKMVALAVLHFNITSQMTSIAPGTRTVLRKKDKANESE